MIKIIDKYVNFESEKSFNGETLTEGNYYNKMEFSVKIAITLILLVGVSVIQSKNVRIIGQKALAGEFPFQAAIYIDTAMGKYFCGGSLINRQWILTAAQCLYNGRMYTIHLGSNTLQAGDPNRVVLASSNAVLHPAFNPDTLENDIGLIKLHLPLELNTYIQVVHVASVGDIVEGTTATATGWGQISDDTTGIVNDLYYVNMLVISNEECKLTYQDQVKPMMICTAGNYDEGICTGDTGGPLTIKKGLHEYIQIGVGSFFSGQGCQSLHPSGFTRLDIYVDWIMNVTLSV